MSTNTGKRLQDGIVALSFLLLTAGQVTAQQSLSPKDSLAIGLQVDMLKHRILIAGNLYRAEKFRIPLTGESKADSLMLGYITEYQRLYSHIPERMLPGYFTLAFYKETLPVVQYTRNPHWAGLFLEHQEHLHPAPVMPDPKHQHEAEKDHAHTH